SPIITDMPKGIKHGNKAEDALIQMIDVEVERDAILTALMSLSIISRQILHYSFCVQDHYSNYKIAREVGYSERSIQRMKSEALIEFAEAYRNGKIIAYK
ncbi:TPA: autolysin, partial [Enterococcus faecalis]|nr:autolysin [Enterococcus faecalis]